MEKSSAPTFFWKRRSRQSLGAQWLTGLLFLAIGAAIGFSSLEPSSLRWTLLSLSLIGFLIALFWQVPEEGKSDSEDEDLIDLARRAIESEASRLDRKRANLEKIEAEG
ncbi:MAG: hypothetical protein AAGC68_07770 [Verrucomicrobiota bacterium]